MKRREAAIALALGAGLGAGLGVSALLAPPLPAGGSGPRQPLLISSAAALLPLTRAWADAFGRLHPGVNIVVEQGGALPAYLAARNGAIDVAAMTRALTDSEDDAGARHFLVAKGRLDVIVPAAAPLHELSREQVRALLTGAARDWRAVGGADRPVRVHAPARGTVTRRLAEDMLLDGGDFAAGAVGLPDAAAVAAAVAADPGGIGIVAAAGLRVPATVRALALDGVPPRRATVLSGRYPAALGCYLLLHGEPGGMRADFLAFALGPAGQRIAAALGLLPVR